MGKPQVSEAEFVNVWHECAGSPTRVAERLSIGIRNVYQRRERMAARGTVLQTIAQGNAPASFGTQYKPAYPREKRIELANGTILIFSDAHIWPGDYTVAMRGVLAAIPALRPDMIVANGDLVDGAQISRHARIGWARTPTMREELTAVQTFLNDVVATAIIANPDCAFEWNVGNHDLRFDNYLSRQAPEFEGMPLMRLEDHFPRWAFQWSLLVNESLMVKHRFANGGIHSGYNATLKAGYSTASGHTHLLAVSPWSDYRGRRWGTSTGGLLDLHAAALEYTENHPSPACSGFAVFTFRDGQLLPPELAEVIGGRCYFRGQAIA